MVLGVCRRILHHQQDAEDAFQATFMVLVRRGHSLNRPELLGNWLYGVAYRTAQKARASLARRRHHERQVQPMPPIEPSNELEASELRGVLDDELKQLPAKYRSPLVLCYLEGMTNEQAAHRLGWPVGSMSYRLARGRQLLRERLQRRRQMVPGLALTALLQQHASPAEVPVHLADATLRAAMDASRPRPISVPPVPLAPPSPAAQAASAAASHFRWRGVVAAVLLLVTGSAAAGAWYMAHGGSFGSASQGNTASAEAPAAGTSPSLPTCCH
jgi:RNA polymerase sigma-70 factor (ECF subfamily)